MKPHYREFIIHMTGLVNTGADSRRLQLLAWRETSVQHFDAPGGHVDASQPQGRYCVPIGDRIRSEGGNTERLGGTC